MLARMLLTVTLVVFAGCLQIEKLPVLDEPVLDPGIYIVDLDGIRPAPDHPAVSGVIDANGTRVSIDMVPIMAADTMALVYLEYLDWGTGQIVTRVAIPQDDRRLGDTQEVGDYCWTQMDAHAHPLVAWDRFDIFTHAMDIAQGGPGLVGDPAYPASGIWVGGDTSRPLSSEVYYTSTRNNDHIAPGARQLFMAATSGISYGEMLQPDAQWTINIENDVPTRIYILPSTDWFCGLGFSRLDNVQHVPGLVPYSAGGHKQADPLYGASIGMAYQFPDGDAGPHDATFTVNGTRMAADPAGMVFTTPRATDLRLDNEQWVGRALWVLSGFPMPVNGWFEGNGLWMSPDGAWETVA